MHPTGPILSPGRLRPGASVGWALGGGRGLLALVLRVRGEPHDEPGDPGRERNRAGDEDRESDQTEHGFHEF